MDIRMCDVEKTLMEEIADKQFTRNDIAETYFWAIKQQDVDFQRVNLAITKRWSLSGLRYIKEKAWKLGGKG